jgi:hypothetical protein
VSRSRRRSSARSRSSSVTSLRAPTWLLYAPCIDSTAFGCSAFTTHVMAVACARPAPPRRQLGATSCQSHASRPPENSSRRAIIGLISPPTATLLTYYTVVVPGMFCKPSRSSPADMHFSLVLRPLYQSILTTPLSQSYPYVSLSDVSASSSPSTATRRPCTAASTSATKLSMNSRSRPTSVTVLWSLPQRG